MREGSEGGRDGEKEGGQTPKDCCPRYTGPIQLQPNDVVPRQDAFCFVNCDLSLVYHQDNNYARVSAYPQ